MKLVEDISNFIENSENYLGEAIPRARVVKGLASDLVTWLRKEASSKQAIDYIKNTPVDRIARELKDDWWEEDIEKLKDHWKFVQEDAIDMLQQNESVDLEEQERLSDVDVEEGKMRDILGVPEDGNIGEDYDGSPEDAVAELVSEVGESEAASMINWAAGINDEGDEFLEEMQDVIGEKDFGESKSIVQDISNFVVESKFK